LKAFAQSGADKGKGAAAETDRLISGLKLLQTIDKYSYMQIPVILGGRPSTVELYVFNKKTGAKKKASEGMTFLLALETENLGHVEALVNIRESTVSIRFNVRSEEIADYLRKRTTALYNMVYIKEYRLSGFRFIRERSRSRR
jgi:hypothetical protein